MYAGDLVLAEQRAADYTESSSAGLFLASSIANIMASLIATYRGKFPDTISSIEQGSVDPRSKSAWGEYRSRNVTVTFLA
jgi:hypothetical protein